MAPILAPKFGVKSKKKKRVIIFTEKKGIFYREHQNRRFGVHRDRQYVIRQTLGGETRVSTFGWIALAKMRRADADEFEKIDYSVTSYGDACNRAEIYRENYQHNIMNPGSQPLPICKMDEIDAANKLATQIEQQKKAQAHKNTTFADFFEETYLPLQTVNKKNPVTIKREQALCKYHLAPVLGSLTFSEIQPLHLERIKKNMTLKKLSPRSIQYALAVARQVWNLANRDGLATGNNPSKDVKRPKVNNLKDRYFSPEEEKALLAKLIERSPIMHDMTIMSLDTGARWSELAKLKWQQVDIKGATVRLIDTKAGDDRTCHVATRRVLEMLKQRQKEEKKKAQDKKSVYVFPARDGSEQTQVNNVFFRTIKDLKFNKGVDTKHRLSFHSCRHTCASRLAMAGVSLYVIKEILGHHTITTTERYAHLSPSTQRNALELLEQSNTTEPVVDIRTAKK